MPTVVQTLMSIVIVDSRSSRFLRFDHEEEAGDEKIQASRTMLLAYGDGQIKSHAQRVANFSFFELYCLVLFSLVQVALLIIEIKCQFD